MFCLIIKNITNLAHADYPESHSVSSFMVYAQGQRFFN